MASAPERNRAELCTWGEQETRALQHRSDQLYYLTIPGAIAMKSQTKQDLVNDGLERVEAAAEFLKISRAKMREIIRLREIRTVHIGRCVRVPRQALIAFAASKMD